MRSTSTVTLFKSRLKHLAEHRAHFICTLRFFNNYIYAFICSSFKYSYCETLWISLWMKCAFQINLCCHGRLGFTAVYSFSGLESVECAQKSWNSRYFRNSHFELQLIINMTQTDTCLVFELRILFTELVDCSVKWIVPFKYSDRFKQNVPGAHCSDRDIRGNLQTWHHGNDLEIFIWIWESDELAALFYPAWEQAVHFLVVRWNWRCCEDQTSPWHAEGSEEDVCQRPTQSCLITVATLGCCDVSQRSVLSHTFVSGARPNCHASFLHNVPCCAAGPRTPLYMPPSQTLTDLMCTGWNDSTCF